jgi:NAD(P)-dependent dehydrogenase (short-subunit alcohol dehydrogenase family)
MKKLDGKVAIVTGAASGIGRETALLFAAEGATVVAADWDKENGPRVVDQISDAGGTSIFVPTDVANPSDAESMVQAAARTFGGLHVLFNNAGVIGDKASTVDCSLENWDRVVEINLKGVFLGMKYAIPVMLESGGGSIINNASIAGQQGFRELPAYTAAKGGVVSLTKTSALEYGKLGIRVNVICSGSTLTPMLAEFYRADNRMEQYLESKTPMGRSCQPVEVARVALFLACDDSSYCTGASFIVDGGALAE